MNLHPPDLEKIADLTLEHYNQHAEDFWEGTRDHNISQNIEAPLQTIEGDPPFAILDIGCRPGRPQGICRTRPFRDKVGRRRALGHYRAHSGGEVWQQDFLKVLAQHPHSVRLTIEVPVLEQRIETVRVCHDRFPGRTRSRYALNAVDVVAPEPFLVLSAELSLYVKCRTYMECQPGGD